MFAAEKVITVNIAEVGLMRGQKRLEPWLARKSPRPIPALELDDGRCLTEIMAICECRAKMHTGPTPEER